MPEVCLQRNGWPNSAACGKHDVARSWDLVNVTCSGCKESRQYRDAIAFGDIGSPGRETGYPITAAGALGKGGE